MTQILTEGDATEQVFNTEYFESMEACQEWYFEAVGSLLSLAATPTDDVLWPATFGLIGWDELKTKLNAVVSHLLTLRFGHRANKNYKAGDDIRKRLAEFGIEVRDNGKNQIWEYNFFDWRDLRKVLNLHKPFPCKTRPQHWLDKLEAGREAGNGNSSGKVV